MHQQRRKNLYLRANIIKSIRDFFHQQEFLEIETPLMIPANAPEEFIEPIAVQSNFLQTSPELCMKRMLCQGYDKLFQISHCWRQGERGNKHLPEFTMIEWYRANSDYHDLMLDCQMLLKHLEPLRTHQSTAIFNKAAQTITVTNAYAMYAGKSVISSLADDSFDEIMATAIEPSLPTDSPVFLIDYPVEKASLSRLKESDPSVAERFELYVGGIEIANGFSELNNPEEQRKRFIAANKTRISIGAKALPLPEKFLAELSKMPPSAGIALGIDRLVMLAAGTDIIDHVVSFTPEEL